MSCSRLHQALWRAEEAVGGWQCWARSSSRVGSPLPSLPTPFSFRCTGSRTVHVAQQHPSSSPGSVKKSLSRAEWDPAAAPLGCLKTLGGARRATGPGSSVLLCHFIEERWYRGESTSAARGEAPTDSWLPWWTWALGAPWSRIWRGMAGILLQRVGKAEVVGDGRGSDLWSDPASNPLPTF